MVTMTMEPAMLKKAMGNIGLEDRVDDLLDQIDEIELDRRLKISLEQADSGETMSLEELEKRTEEKMKNGYLLSNPKLKSIEEKNKAIYELVGICKGNTLTLDDIKQERLSRQ